MSAAAVFEGTVGDGIVAGSSTAAVAPLGATLDLLGLSVAALPPGRVDATFRARHGVTPGQAREGAK